MPKMSIVDRLRREADLLHKALRSKDHSVAEAAAERFKVLHRFSALSPAEILQLGKEVKHRDALQVVALEAGHPGWDAFSSTVAQSTERLKASEQIDWTSVAAGMIPWRVDAYLKVSDRMARHGLITDDKTFYSVLSKEILSTRTAQSLTELQSHIEWFQNIHLWLNRHEEALAAAGIISIRGEEVGLSAEVLLHLTASPYTVTALKAPGLPWRTFDIHQIAGDSILTHWKWQGERVWRAADREVQAEHTTTPLLSGEERVTSTTWYYTFDRDSRPVKLTRAVAEGLFYGREVGLPENLLQIEKEILLAGVVMLMVDGTPRWIERVRTLSLDPAAGSAYALRGTIEMDWGTSRREPVRGPDVPWASLAGELLRRGKGPVADSERLALYLQKTEGGNLPVQLSLAMGNRTTSDAHQQYANMSLWSDRSSTLWDLPFGRPVPQGLPLIPSQRDRTVDMEPPKWLVPQKVEPRTEARFRAAAEAVAPETMLERVMRLNKALEQHRRTLLDLAEETDALASHLCQCGSPGCHNRTPEGFPFSRVIDNLSDEWAKEGPGIAVENRIPPLVTDILGPILTKIGDDFNLWELVTCSCDHANCAARNPRTAPPAVKLKLVADAWVLAGGCRHRSGLTAEAAMEAAETNRDLVDSLATKIMELTPEQLRAGLDTYLSLKDLVWHHDVNSRIAHCLRDYWGEDAFEQIGRTLTGMAIWGASKQFEGSKSEREELQHALALFVYGIAADGLAHPIVTEPFLAPFVKWIDLNALREDSKEMGPIWRQVRGAVRGNSGPEEDAAAV